jgi:hypothetical protein
MKKQRKEEHRLALVTIKIVETLKKASICSLKDTSEKKSWLMIESGFK